MVKSSPLPVRTADALPRHVRQVVSAVHDKKGFDVLILDLTDSDAFTDYFVMCSAKSTRQVRSVVDEIGQQLGKLRNRPSHIEGYDHGEWVLMDYFDVVVHVFTQETRHFYNLERLWGNAAQIQIPEPA